MPRKGKVLCLALGTAISAALWLYVAKAYPGPGVKTSALYDVCFNASLPGQFASLLFSSGNHGIGLGITDYEPALAVAGVSINAVLYALVISLGWRVVAKVRRSRQTAPTCR